MHSLLLTRPHTHAGKHYQRADRIEVDTDTAQWLVTQGIATREPKAVRIESDLSPLQRKESKA